MSRKTTGKRILLLGDSLIEYGDWQEFLSGYVTSNRGRAGETVGELSVRLAEEMEHADDPDHILIMSGTNNLLMGDQAFPAVFSTMLPRLRLMEPEADVSIIGIPPLRLSWIREETPATINSRLKQISIESGCRFLDIAPYFALHCRPTGNPCFLADGVHFSPHGYKVLARAVTEHLKSES